MGKAKRTKRKDITEPMDTPTEAQLAQGGYDRRYVRHWETNTLAMAHVSSHDPVERWLRDGRLSDTQEVAINAIRRLWRLAGLSQRVTANYSERVGHGHVETQALTEIEAREDLHRIKGYFGGHLRTYFDVFENVCRWGMPAGVAGEALGYGTRSAQDRAHMIVCLVADFIAAKERW